MSSIQTYVEKHKIDTKSIDYCQLRTMLEKHQGYVILFLKFRYEQRIRMERLQELFQEITSNKNLFKDNLPKPIHEYTDFYDLVLDMKKVRQEKSFRQFINLFPSQLKEVLRAEFEKGYFEHSYYGWINDFNALSKEVQEMFYRNISKYKKSKPMWKDLEIFLQYIRTGKDWNTILKKIKTTEGAHLRIADEERKIILATITSWSAMQELGKGTGWCIADRWGDSHWKTHFLGGKRTQYILWDFNFAPSSTRHRIGLTIDEKGTILHCHQNGNKAFDFYKFMESKKYLEPAFFSGSDSFEHQLEVLSSGSNASLSQNIIRLFGELSKRQEWDKVSKTILYLVKEKIYSDQKLVSVLQDLPIDKMMQQQEVALAVFKQVGSTKFCRFLAEWFKKMNASTVKFLIDNGLVVNYADHFQTFLNFVVQSNTVPLEEEREEVINGIKYQVRIQRTPMEGLSLATLQMLAQTNLQVITPKLLLELQELDKKDIFETLLAIYNKKITSVAKFTNHYRRCVLAHNEIVNKVK